MPTNMKAKIAVESAIKDITIEFVKTVKSKREKPQLGKP